MSTWQQVRTACQSPAMCDIMRDRLADEIERNLDMAIRHPRFEDKFMEQALLAEEQLAYLNR